MAESKSSPKLWRNGSIYHQLESVMLDRALMIAAQFFANSPVGEKPALLGKCL